MSDAGFQSFKFFPFLVVGDELSLGNPPQKALTILELLEYIQWARKVYAAAAEK